MSIIWCKDDYDMVIYHLLKYYNTFVHLRDYYIKNNEIDKLNILNEKLYLSAKLILLLDEVR